MEHEKKGLCGDELFLPPPTHLFLFDVTPVKKNFWLRHCLYIEDLKIITSIIVYLITKTIHRDLELLTSTSYTAVGSGFDPQAVPAEKPRNLLTHPPSQVCLLGLLLQCENIYLGPQMVH